MCSARLPCGHVCASFCHVYDSEHAMEKSKCYKPCPEKSCAQYEHKCLKSCHYGEGCGPCIEIIDQIRPECGHNYKCADYTSGGLCEEICNKPFPCGHLCKSVCKNPCEPERCLTKIELKADCHHTISVYCSSSKTSALHTKCKVPHKRRRDAFRRFH